MEKIFRRRSGKDGFQRTGALISKSGRLAVEQIAGKLSVSLSGRLKR